jgi:hypothetical protein
MPQILSLQDVDSWNVFDLIFSPNSSRINISSTKRKLVRTIRKIE